jgi:hypothetical protein
MHDSHLSVHGAYVTFFGRYALQIQQQTTHWSSLMKHSFAPHEHCRTRHLSRLSEGSEKETGKNKSGL